MDRSMVNNMVSPSTYQDDNEDDDDHKVVETDPSGRFERFADSLGKGAYKEVFKAFDQEEGVEVAWNQLRVDHLHRKDAQRILYEIQILQSLRNENIINLYHSWVAIGSDGKEKVCFITELMTSGTLKSYIRKTKGMIKPKILKNWARQILNGLHYLHGRIPPIIHRDLKCENIFINGNNGQAKIGDLGLATIKHREHVSSVLGTPEFMAPELYDEKYDEKVDIYAFGMVILEIVTKEYPYSECTNQAQIYKKVSSGIKPNAIDKINDEETKRFIELCIAYNPKQRPSADDLLKHPFLNFQPMPNLSFQAHGIGESQSLDSSMHSFYSSNIPSFSEHHSDSSVGLTSSKTEFTPTEFSRKFSEPEKDDMVVSCDATLLSQPLPQTFASKTQSLNKNQQITPPSLNEFTLPQQKQVQQLLQESVHQKEKGSQDERASESQVVDSNNHTFHVKYGGDLKANTDISTDLSSVSQSQPSTNLSTNSNPAAQSNSATLQVEVEKSTEDTIHLRMLYILFGKKPQEIKFPFSLKEDTVTDVVSEMVSESLIDAKDENMARRKIEEVVRHVLITSRSSSSSSSVRRPSENESISFQHVFMERHPTDEAASSSPDSTRMVYDTWVQPGSPYMVATLPRSRTSSNNIELPRAVTVNIPRNTGTSLAGPPIPESMMFRRNSAVAAPGHGLMRTASPVNNYNKPKSPIVSRHHYFGTPKGSVSSASSISRPGTPMQNMMDTSSDNAHQQQPHHTQTIATPSGLMFNDRIAIAHVQPHYSITQASHLRSNSVSSNTIPVEYVISENGAITAIPFVRGRSGSSSTNVSSVSVPAGSGNVNMMVYEPTRVMEMGDVTPKEVYFEDTTVEYQEAPTASTNVWNEVPSLPSMSQNVQQFTPALSNEDSFSAVTSSQYTLISNTLSTEPECLGTPSSAHFVLNQNTGEAILQYPAPPTSSSSSMMPHSETNMQSQNVQPKVLDPEVQRRLQELQELNLRGLDSLNNSQTNFTRSSSGTYSAPFVSRPHYIQPLNAHSGFKPATATSNMIPTSTAHGPYHHNGQFYYLSDPQQIGLGRPRAVSISSNSQSQHSSGNYNVGKLNTTHNQQQQQTLVNASSSMITTRYPSLERKNAGAGNNSSINNNVNNQPKPSAPVSHRLPMNASANINNTNTSMNAKTNSSNRSSPLDSSLTVAVHQNNTNIGIPSNASSTSSVISSNTTPLKTTSIATQFPTPSTDLSKPAYFASQAKTSSSSSSGSSSQFPNDQQKPGGVSNSEHPISNSKKNGLSDTFDLL